MIEKQLTVAFERHGSELVMIAPDNVEPVFKHYSTVDTVREGIRVVAGISDREADETLCLQWIQLLNQARVEVSNSAAQALNSLGLPLEPQDSTDDADGQAKFKTPTRLGNVQHQ